MSNNTISIPEIVTSNPKKPNHSNFVTDNPDWSLQSSIKGTKNMSFVLQTIPIVCSCRRSQSDYQTSNTSLTLTPCTSTSKPCWASKLYPTDMDTSKFKKNTLESMKKQWSKYGATEISPKALSLEEKYPKNKWSRASLIS